MLIMKRTKVLLLLLIILFAFYSLIVEPSFAIIVVAVKVKLKNLPEDFNGYRIVHLSDTHFGEFHLKLRDDLVLSKVKEIKPDLIVFTGDIVSSKRSVEEAIDFIKKLASIAKVIIVLGNWDYSSGASEILLHKLCSLENVTVLVNNYAVVSRGKSSLYVVGVDDPYTRRSNLSKALENIPQNSTKILLAHSPQIIGEATGKVDLVLAGHTHGGQVVVPFVGPLFVPLPARYKKYVHGLFLVNGTYMYVNRGLGTSILPIRFFAPPEIAVIVLKKSGS